MEYNITNYTGFTIIDEHKENLLSEYIKGSSLMELSNLYNYNISTIRYFLRKCGIKTRGIKESAEKFHKLNSLVIDNVLHENILGWLLGDGGMRIPKKGINPLFIYTDKKYDHILYVQNILTKYNIESLIRLNNNVYNLQSKCYPEFHYYYNIFYGYEGLNENNQKRKILPDIKLTPTILRNWYIGDGCSTKYIKSYNHRGSITCKYKNEYILEQFIDISKNPIGCYKSNNCYNYHFNNKALINLLDYIGECPVESYKYKWIVRRKSTVSDKTCPSCGEDSLVYEEGCLICRSCGYGKC